ncbi:MAG: hypothetical protein LAP85_07585 [Acidobacteriia bacterium]|nr:hypothetical protein [Terriglobia bacterium]
MRDQPNKADASGKKAGEAPVLYGTLTDVKGPIADGMIFLQSLKDEKCAALFIGPPGSADDMKYLKNCAQAVSQVRPDEQGCYRIPIVRPGWYNLRFL